MTDPPSHEPSTPAGEPADADALRDYLKKVSQIPGLTLEQEAGLAQQRETGLAAATKLAAEGDRLTAGQRVDLEWIAERGPRQEPPAGGEPTPPGGSGRPSPGPWPGRVGRPGSRA